MPLPRGACGAGVSVQPFAHPSEGWPQASAAGAGTDRSVAAGDGEAGEATCTAVCQGPAAEGVQGWEGSAVCAE